MSASSPATSKSMLDQATRDYVRCAMAGGLVELDDVKKIVASLIADGTKLTCERLAEGLIAAGMLTEWQSEKLMRGKHKGFFLGSYRLLRPLGRGGMGMVYLGEHHIMKRLMALKILTSDSWKDKRRIERFKDEARASAQLDHPNIVRAYDCAETSGKIYIAMEYVDGVNLQQAVGRDGVMSIAAALDAIKQAAEGLSHAHGRGIVHRDIKPSNLMLRRDGVVKVSDLGLARIGWEMEGDADGPKRLTGTADFVAPEQVINSKTVDARADIYSLGCTVYFLLTGKTPFGGQSISQRLAKHQTSPVPDVRDLRPDCPAALADLIMQMMAKRPEDRPASMSELLVQMNRLSATAGATGKALSSVASLMDTSVDETLMHSVTMEGSSFGGSGPALDSHPSEDFDFSNLPDVVPTDNRPNVGGTSSVGLASAPMLPTGNPAVSAAKPPSSAASDSGGTQQILLGIGLTLAFLALIVVVGMMAYNLQKPLEQPAPKLKFQEDGKEGTMIIVNES